MNLDNITNQIYIVAFNEAKLQGHEFLTPEHILYATLLFDFGKNILEKSGVNIKNTIKDLSIFFEKHLEKLENCDPMESFELIHLFEIASRLAKNADKDKISLGHLIVSFFELTNSFGVYILAKNGLKKNELIKFASHEIDTEADASQKDSSSEPEKENEFLRKYTTELTLLAKENKLDPLIGRDDILSRTLQILSRRLKSNPVHVGEPGVGKSALVEGIAQCIAKGNVPENLKNSKIYYLDMGSIIAGTKYRGDFEERFIKILDIISKEKNPIVYIDEIHTIVGAGAVSGNSIDAANILKPYLVKGNLKIIGSTTYSEYKKYFEKDKALARRFQKIDINEPSIDDCIKIINGIKSKYEEYHNVKYTDEAIYSACTLSDKYITDKKLPDKAIDIIDEAGAYTKLHYSGKKAHTISENIIKKIISSAAKIPVENLSSNEITKLKNLDENLKKEILGQDKAISTIVNAIKASRSGLNDENRPIASLFFVGPTGVGKTEIAKQLALLLDIPLKRFDMSEYQEKHSVARLIGSPPGYVGYEEGGLLTDSINKTPHCVLLLDEIEKAHPDIFNILLQIMDYGKLTDNSGKQSDFRNVILIMTSNAGAKFMNKKVIGFDDRTLNSDAVTSEIEKLFSPEFRNRLDSTVLFNSINSETAYLITKKAVNKLALRLKAKNISLKISEEALKLIASDGFSEIYGARELNRIVENTLKRPLVEEILFGKLTNGGSVSIDVLNNSISLKYRKNRVKKSF